MIKKKLEQPNITNIILNKHIRNEFFIEKELEAGLILQSWEIKSLNVGKVNIRGSYVTIMNNEAFLLGTIFTPSVFISKFNKIDPIRIRKLLLNRHEIDDIYQYTKTKGYTVIVLSLYWKNIWCKVKIGIAKGKKKYDKRLNIKKREWLLSKERIMKRHKINLN